MKSSVKHLLTFCLVLLSSIIIFTSCTNSAPTAQSTETQAPTETAPTKTQATPQKTQEHIHSFGEWVTVKEADCSQKSEQERVCTCGEKESKTGELGNHVYKNEKCTVCGKEQYNKDLSFALVYDVVAVTGIGSCTDKEISIPPTYNNMPVEYIEEDAFKNCTQITSVTIPDSIKRIEDNAFKDCTNLKSVSLPNNITDISLGVFEGCTSLTDITIPSSVASIGVYSFKGCTSLTKVTIPSSIKTISSNAFENCTSLSTITIPGSVETIGAEAFKGCTSLTDIYCKAASQPIGWFTAWNAGCSAKIHWGN